jgi:hypothetical protein
MKPMHGVRPGAMEEGRGWRQGRRQGWVFGVRRITAGEAFA